MFDGWFASKMVIYNQQNVWCSMFFSLDHTLTAALQRIWFCNNRFHSQMFFLETWETPKGPWISWSEWNFRFAEVTLGRRGRGFDWNDTTIIEKTYKILGTPAHLSHYSLHTDSMVNPGDCFICITNHIDIECKWWVHWGSKYHHFQCCYQCMWGGWRLGSCVACHGKIVRRR